MDTMDWLIAATAAGPVIGALISPGLGKGLRPRQRPSAAGQARRRRLAGEMVSSALLARAGTV